jgi:hypothetical protein
MFVKCHYCLHPLVEYKEHIVDQGVEKDNNFDIFKLIVSTSEPTMELINRELLISSIIKCMSKTSNVHFDGGENMKIYFPQLIFVLNFFKG